MEFVGCISGIMLDRTTYDSSTITTVGNVPQCTEGGAMSSAHFFNGDSSLIPGEKERDLRDKLDYYAFYTLSY